MKKIKTTLLTITTILCMAACQNEGDYKVIRKQVLDRHDQIMMDGEKAMNDKMMLDTLALSGLAKLKAQQPSLDTAAEHQEIKRLTKKLDDADERMNDWMHNFKTDVDGKSNQQAVDYFNGQKTKIAQLDSLYKALLKEAAVYLQKFNLKADTTMKSMDHMKM
ncbi:hypothetical protein BDD43_4386 [Mucilaginibacter gracilis]|uniref:Viral A-type inclusion protein n=1 Tax=Mucilaginibacter gracilis TaxID=423350 RepID=A0A495J808_9SPHI|nr:hypothetical protein [Mucilaginibacter gracilis]RKR84159.1 hypothetical protein BDD43_4386 [Mucilaginibacter gracilis]